MYVVLSVVFLVVFSLVLYMATAAMRQINSHPLPSYSLNIILAHFKEMKTRAQWM